MPAGRPTIYTEQLGAEICKRIAEGASLRSICNGPVNYDPMVDEDNHSHMPAISTVLSWGLDINHEFSAQYGEARRQQMEYYGDTLKEVSERPDTQRARLISDNTKWLMARLSSSRYGDRTQTELVGKDGAELNAGVSNQLASVMAAALAKRGQDDE